MKFTLKSDYALNIIAIDKPPKYELKDTSCSTEKAAYCKFIVSGTNCSNAASFDMNSFFPSAPPDRSK